MRALLAALLALGALAAPGVAHAQGLLVPADAAELANNLAEARAEQGVCYGWRVTIDTPQGVRRAAGSSLGPGVPVPLGGAECPQAVELVADILYTSESSEAEDAAQISIRGTLPELPSTEDLAGLGYTPEDLLGDQDDLALANMVGALPVLVADAGAVPYVPYEPTQLQPAQQGRPTGSPGSDFLRDAWPGLVLGGLFVIGGIGWWWFARRGRLQPVPKTSQD